MATQKTLTFSLDDGVDQAHLKESLANFTEKLSEFLLEPNTQEGEVMLDVKPHPKSATIKRNT